MVFRNGVLDRRGWMILCLTMLAGFGIGAALHSKARSGEASFSVRPYRSEGVQKRIRADNTVEFELAVKFARRADGSTRTAALAKWGTFPTHTVSGKG